MTEPGASSRYLTFDRQAWSHLRAATPLTLEEPELEKLRGINDRIDMDEVATVYLPLSRLLNLYVSATQDLHKVSATFLGTIAPKVPYVIGIAGSVAVGKSTFARILQALLAQWPDHPKVDLITTDGFLYPNRILEERGIMNRKGFPESYDTRELLHVLRQIKSGEAVVEAPVYSHVVYDIVPDDRRRRAQPDIVIIEGLNVLQTRSGAPEFVSDYFDFSIYIDADEPDIEQWYVERFLALRAIGVPGPELVLPVLRRAERRRGRRDRPPDLARDQRAEPAREHRADPGPGLTRRAQDRRPPCRPGPTPTALIRDRARRGPRRWSSAPRRPRRDRRPVPVPR